MELMDKTTKNIRVIINQTYPLMSLDAVILAPCSFYLHWTISAWQVSCQTQVKLARTSELSDHMSSMSLDCSSQSITAYCVHTQKTAILLFPTKGSSTKHFEVADNLNLILEPVSAGCKNKIVQSWDFFSSKTVAFNNIEAICSSFFLKKCLINDHHRSTVSSSFFYLSPSPFLFSPPHCSFCLSEHWLLFTFIKD